MKYVALAARILLGLIFFVFGLNGFLNFIPSPDLTSMDSMAYMKGLGATGYFFPLLKVTEIVCGLAFLSGRFVPLALVIIAPVIVQIFAFHAILEPGGLPMSIALVVFEGFLGYTYRSAFSALLNPNTAA